MPALLVVGAGLFLSLFLFFFFFFFVVVVVVFFVFCHFIGHCSLAVNTRKS